MKVKSLVIVIFMGFAFITNPGFGQLSPSPGELEEWDLLSLLERQEVLQENIKVLVWSNDQLLEETDQLRSRNKQLRYFGEGHVSPKIEISQNQKLIRADHQLIEYNNSLIDKQWTELVALRPMITKQTRVLAHQ